MLNKPQFKSCYRVEVVESVGVFLLSELDYCLLTGKPYELLAPQINGDRSVEDLVNLLQDELPAAEVYYTLMLMKQKGYIVESNSDLPLGVKAFLEGLNVDIEEARERLRSTKVSVKSLYQFEPKMGRVDLPNRDLAIDSESKIQNPKSKILEFITILESLNIEIGEDGDIEVVLTDDYLQSELDTFNQKAIRSQRPWMLVKPVGQRIWLGPLFVPERTGCWQCLAQRLRANRPVETFIQKHKIGDRESSSSFVSTSVSVIPSTWQTGLNLAATELFKWIVQAENKLLEGNLVTFDTISLEREKHSLVKRPQCHACGEARYLSNRKPSPLILESRKKTFTDDGGHRCASPEETLKRYGHHISPITGAVRSLTLVDNSRKDLTPCYAAGHNFATMFDSLYFLRQNLRGRSGGKGRTDTQARASALCEAIERYSGVFQGDEITCKNSYNQMGDRSIHPNACMGFSDYQYQTRQEWNAICPSFFHKVPEPFDEEREIDWTPIWSLTHQDFKYLPTAYCYYGYPKPDKVDCWADSNGTAAGNTKEEAILQGFMELVERDAVALWWYNRLKQPAVDLDSFDQPYFRQLQEYYRSINRKIWVLDITSDLNVPAFAALSSRIDRDRNKEEIIYGFGAHFDPIIGITRALTEINQVLPAVFATNADGTTKYNFADRLALDWWQTATLKDCSYLLPDASIAAKTNTDYPQLLSDDLLEDVQTCVKIAAKHGLETLVLDQTRPDIGLNVVKVVVPGLRHFWKRWGTGRLYEVPVKLGKITQPLAESELNPFPIFF
jgi:ribosomal protein S12 methylthiotransferase accessory factor